MKKGILYSSIFIVVFIVTLIVTICLIKKTDIISQNVYEVYGDRLTKKSFYNNPIVPEGFKKVETDTASWELENGIPKGWNSGLVIEDEIGNQFVWVPISDKDDLDLSKYSVIGDIIDGPGKNESEKEFLQNEKYEGFYISRYEAGLPKDIQNNVKEYSADTNNVKGIPVSKKEQIVWNFIDWNQAKKNAQLMYNDKRIKSDLVTRQQWDRISYWLYEENQEIETKKANDYGNYYDVEFNFTGYYSTDYGKTYQYAKNKNKEIGNMLLSTGATERNKTKNIYDLSGNVCEFRDEDKSIYNDKISKEYNTVGGHYAKNGEYSIRSTNGISLARSNQGFRIVLYLE